MFLFETILLKNDLNILVANQVFIGRHVIASFSEPSLLSIADEAQQCKESS